jgi:hypothetical protein
VPAQSRRPSGAPGGDPPGAPPPTELQQWLAGLSAPAPLIRWAVAVPDRETCWSACPTPEWLLWLAARLASTPQERRAIVGCLASVIRRAGRAGQGDSGAIERAVSAAEAWARAEAAAPGQGGPDLAAAGAAAREAAARAGAATAVRADRARMLMRSTPRGRHASAATGRALGACADWRKSGQAWRLALAAAGVTRAAAEAGASPPADRWAAGVSEAAGYAAAAMAGRVPDGRDDKAARQLARVVRRHLPCPAP